MGKGSRQKMVKLGEKSQNGQNHHHHPKCKSPNHQTFMARITKSPHFFEVNRHHDPFLESPNHRPFLASITNHHKYLSPPVQSGGCLVRFDCSNTTKANRMSSGLYSLKNLFVSTPISTL